MHLDEIQSIAENSNAPQDSTEITKLQKRVKPAGPVKACGQTVPQDPNGSYHCADIIHLKLTNLEMLYFLHFATVQRKGLAASAAIFPQ